MVTRTRTAGLALLLLAGCLDATSERTRRDFEEIGNARVGAIQARIEPGVALWTEPTRPLVRFRAGAPSVLVRLHSDAGPGGVATRVAVEVENLPADVTILPAQEVAGIGPKTVRLEVEVAPGSTVEVRLASAAASSPGPFRFAWVGDVQGGLEGFARVRERLDGDPSVEFVLFAGDVTERGTEEQVRAFVQAANPLRVPWYSVLGNHETIQGNEQNFERAIGRLNVCFDYRGARFLLVDSASATVDARVYGFIDEVLARPGAPVRIAAMHLPPFDYSGWRDGGFASRDEAARLMSRLAGGGVDLLLAGHLHTLHLSGGGVLEPVVSGNGGVEREAQWDGSSLHYLAVGVDPVSQRVGIEPVLLP